MNALELIRMATANADPGPNADAFAQLLNKLYETPYETNVRGVPVRAETRIATVSIHADAPGRIRKWFTLLNFMSTEHKAQAWLRDNTSAYPGVCLGDVVTFPTGDALLAAAIKAAVSIARGQHA